MRFIWKGKRYLIRVINDLVNLRIEKSRKEKKISFNETIGDGVIQKLKGKDGKK